MKEISPYPRPGTLSVLTDPEDPVSNGRFVQETGDAPNLRDYWQVVTKHKWKIAGLLCCRRHDHVPSSFFQRRLFIPPGRHC